MTEGELQSEDLDNVALTARVLRGLALIAASVVTIAVVTVHYVDPQLVSFARHAAITPAPGPSYRISAIDFVDPSTGWIVADYATGEYSILHTADGGATWTRQLTELNAGRGHYMKFFDTA